MTSEHRSQEELAGPFLYFAYGSNLDIERLRRSCPSAEFVTVAELAGYRLEFSLESRSWRGGVADIRPDAGTSVWGAVWRISDGESSALDRQEGVHLEPPRYRRMRVEVTTGAGERVTCWTYQVVAPEPGEHPPAPAYLETIRRGARAVRLPAAYLEMLAQIQDNGVAGCGPA